ncbi:MAG: hypothetical protein ACIAQF_12745 [Phycisphaerales bacterium JB065]
MKHRTNNRRAAALAGAVSVIAALNFLIIGSVSAGGEDQHLAAYRVDAVRAALGVEAATAVVIGELSSGRPIPIGETELPGGHRVTIESDAEYPPMEVDIEARWGQATRAVRIRIE